MTKLRKSAKGKNCTVRIPGYCNHNQETTVLAHRNGSGVGRKHKDIFGAYVCSSCHDVIDGRVYAPEYNREEIIMFFYEGIFETQEVMLADELIKIAGEK